MGGSCLLVSRLTVNDLEARNVVLVKCDRTISTRGKARSLILADPEPFRLVICSNLRDHSQVVCLIRCKAASMVLLDVVLLLQTEHTS